MVGHGTSRNGGEGGGRKENEAKNREKGRRRRKNPWAQTPIIWANGQRMTNWEGRGRCKGCEGRVDG